MKLILTTIILSVIFLPFISISAQGLNEAFNINNGGNDDPLDLAASNAGYETANAKNAFDSAIAKVINIALSMLGIIFLVLTIFAGYLWMTASGNEQQLSRAKSVLVSSIIGIIIVVSAYAISFFVLKSVQDGALKGEQTGNNTESTGE